MSIGDMYPVVLSLVLVGMIIGIGILILDKFGQTSGIGSTASTAINNTRDAVDDFVTWIPVIVLVVAAAIILGLVINSFRGNQ